MSINEINEFQAFAILGLKPTALEQEFRARFKELAQNGESEDFQRISIAKEILDIYFHEMGTVATLFYDDLIEPYTHVSFFCVMNLDADFSYFVTSCEMSERLPLTQDPGRNISDRY